MIREINVKELTDNISEMCIQANHYLSPDMDVCMKQAVETEKSELGKKILNQLQENLEIRDKSGRLGHRMLYSDVILCTDPGEYAGK